MRGKGQALKFDAGEQERIRQYLLGQLPPEDSAELEERLLSDSDFFEELLIAEDELIDQYLGDDLSQAERSDFETQFLTAPERQQRVRFARSLKKYVGTATATATKTQADVDDLDSAQLSTAGAKPRPKKPPFFSFLPANNPILSYSLALAVLALVIGGSWIAVKNWRDPSSHKKDNVLAVVLTPGLTRDGGELIKVQVPTEVDTLRLRLALPVNEYESFRATLLTEERTEVWANEGLRLGENVNVLEFDVPARVLKPGDYQVKVSGQLSNGRYEDLSSYRFRLIS